jgi:hypothetical protein
MIVKNTEDISVVSNITDKAGYTEISGCCVQALSEAYKKNTWISNCCSIEEAESITSQSF